MTHSGHAASFNNIVGDDERLHGLEIDHQLEFVTLT
jgi:hypothetical protein